MKSDERVVEVVAPIGGYSRIVVTAPCGLAGQTGLIGALDDPVCFYEPGRLEAGLLWFHSGYVEYLVDGGMPDGAAPVALEVSVEICSDAPAYNERWPSDVTLWINDREVGTWTCPGDFGGRRAHLTPDWWSVEDTQYGLLKRWRVDAGGTFLDDAALSPVTVHDLALASGMIPVRLGVKADASHVGGVNLFGHTFGNHPQDLVLRVAYAARG